jgi:hypothetical protein
MLNAIAARLFIVVIFLNLPDEVEAINQRTSLS